MKKNGWANLCEIQKLLIRAEELMKMVKNELEHKSLQVIAPSTSFYRNGAFMNYQCILIVALSFWLFGQRRQVLASLTWRKLSYDPRSGKYRFEIGFDEKTIRKAETDSFLEFPEQMTPFIQFFSQMSSRLKNRWTQNQDCISVCVTNTG